MLVFLVVFGLAVGSEAGVIHQHQAGVGLNYHQVKSYPARPTLGRPYIAPPIALRPAHLSSSFVLNSVPYNYAVSPLTVTRVAPPLLHSPVSGYPISTVTKSLPTVGSAPLATLSNHIPSAALNLFPINAALKQSASNIQISPATTFLNQPATISNAPVGTPLLASSAVPTITSSYKIVKVIPEKAISYSISHQDYEYLKRHKVEGQDSPYNPIPGFNTSPGNEKHENSHSHHEDNKAPINKTDSKSDLKRTALNIQGKKETKSIHTINDPVQANSEISFTQSNKDLSLIQGNIETSFTQSHEEQTHVQGDSGPILINLPEPVLQGKSEINTLVHGNNGLDLIQGNDETQFIQGNSGSINIEGNSRHNFINVPEPVILQGNINSNFVQQGSNELNLIPGNSGNSLTQDNSGPTYIQGNFESSFVNVAEPVVSKHIYFHVPPPDFEEPPRVPITNLPTPKKTYNILFIKAPSQNQLSNVFLQQNQIEDKTLIYVLSKKQDPVEVALPPQQLSKVSSPEVYFVKYKTKLGDASISHAGNELVEHSLVESISSTPLDQ